MTGKRTPFRAAVAQINTTVGDLNGNRQKIVKAIRQAWGYGAELVTFPELALTGYPPEDILFQRRFVSDNLRLLKSLLPETRGITIVVGFVDRDGRGRLYNAAAVIADERILGIYHKVALPNYGVFDEKRYFYAGDRKCLIQRNGVCLGITICEDIWQKEGYVYQKGRFNKASLFINISASPYHVGKERQRETLLKSLAQKIKKTVIYHNLVGGQDELVFDGGSLIVSPAGKVIAQAKRFEEDLLIHDIAIRSSSSSPARPPAPLPRRQITRPVSSEEEEVYKALVLGTRDYLRKNGFIKALVGLSGGIDSALVARIAADALGENNVIGVTMPSPFTSGETYRDAKELAKRIGIQCLEFGIVALFDAYLKTLKPAFQGRPRDIAEENLQARIRGNLLMALSNKFGYLVLTTGNKSEMATGYCTLYGDMAGGFAVIKDVPKTMVFRLARYRNRLGPRDSIPSSILKRPPTAELRPNQKDQDTLPPYPLLDRFLKYYVEMDMSLEKIVRSGIPKKVALKLAKRVDGNEYKRRQAPPGVKITPKAFGRERRMPITNRYTP